MGEPPCPIVNGHECVLRDDPAHTITDLHQYRTAGDVPVKVSLRESGSRVGRWVFTITATIRDEGEADG